MKVDCAVMSVNDDPFYKDLWPVVSKVWSKRIGIKPILVNVTKNNEPEKSEYGEIIKMPLIEGIPEYVQAQWARFWYASTMGDLVSIISDIDMIPISKRYFVGQIEPLPVEYVHINPQEDAGGKLPACYHVAMGWLYQEYLNINSDWTTAIKQMFEYCKTHKAQIEPVGESEYWFADETYTQGRLSVYDVHSIPRPNGFNSHRINRIDWRYDANNLDDYYDCHCLRPYSSYKDEIDKLVGLLVNG
jgi:hypothetical protein